MLLLLQPCFVVMFAVRANQRALCRDFDFRALTSGSGRFEGPSGIRAKNSKRWVALFRDAVALVSRKVAWQRE